MDTDNTDNTDNTDIELDAEGHRLRRAKLDEAGTDLDDAEGHRLRRAKLDEAGDDGDAEGHAVVSKR